MTREFTCIVCPNGCSIRAELEGGAITAVEGALCPKGDAYVRQELTDPRRTIASSVRLEGGALPLVSVRLTAPVPKARLTDVMEAIKAARLRAPVRAGDVVLHDVLGLGADVIVTKNVESAAQRPDKQPHHQ